MKFFKEILGWVGSLALAMGFAILISVFVFQPTKVLGSSMEPTLQNHERVYISKLSHTFGFEPNYGDIVIIDSRVNEKRTIADDLRDNPLVNLITGKEREVWIKRVIGKPGDVLEFKDHKVYRNGNVVDEPYLKEIMQYSSNKKITVPANHVFVMGDNRNNSEDSRFIGPVPLDHVLGKKVF